MKLRNPDLEQWDDNVIELTVGGQQRIVLNTMHGQIIIDVRPNDVNSFTNFGPRKDVTLIPSE